MKHSVGLDIGCERDFELSACSDLCLKMPSTETYRVQEFTLLTYHALCAMVEEEMFGKLSHSEVLNMTIDEQMRVIVSEIVSEHGVHYKISRKELHELLRKRFHTTPGSIIPSDYCYDHVNRGIKIEQKPRLFRFLGNGMYECLGENFPFTGDVEDARGITVGSWQDGVFHKNENWELVGLK